MMASMPSSSSSSALEKKTKKWRQAFRLAVICCTWDKKTKRWQRVGEACHHLLDLKKKNKEMTTSRRGSSSSPTLEEKKEAKKWRWTREARCHLLHSRKNAEDDDKLGGSRLNVISWVSFQLWTQRLHRHLMHLLGLYDLNNYIS
jgi:hypothetical protein